MDNLKIIFYPPKEGTPTLAVFYHVINEKQIRDTTGLEAYGYIIEEEGAKEVCAGHIHEGPTSKDCPKCKELNNAKS